MLEEGFFLLGNVSSFAIGVLLGLLVVSFPGLTTGWTFDILIDITLFFICVYLGETQDDDWREGEKEYGWDE